MICPRCQQEIPESENVCRYCQTDLTLANNPYSAPVDGGSQQRFTQAEGDSTGGLIPYKNPKALIEYYLGIVSGFPLLGLPFGVAAFVLGILGLRDRKKNPVIKGSAHAWVGIGCGGIFSLLWGLLLVGILVAAIAG